MGSISAAACCRWLQAHIQTSSSVLFRLRRCLQGVVAIGGVRGTGSKYLGGSSQGKCREVQGPAMEQSPLWAQFKGGKDSGLSVSRGSVIEEEMLSEG